MTSSILSQNTIHSQDQIHAIQECDLSMATQFLSTLAGDELVTFQTFDDTERKDKSLIKILHGTLEDHAEELIQFNQRGAGVFVTVNETDGKGRQTGNITKVRAVFVDLDGAPLQPVHDAPISPHIIVESSSGRYHAYWFMDDLKLEVFKSIQQSLAKRFNSDPKVIDLPRVMRLPGFFHQKMKDPFLTRVLETSGALPIKSEQFIPAFGFEIGSSVDEKAESDQSIKIALTKAKIYLGNDGQNKGRHKIKCPWSDLHSTPGGEAHYFEPYTNGYSGHGFKCFHDHCKHRKGEDLLNWLGELVKGSAHIDEPWGIPVPLPEGLPSVSVLEPEMLPEALSGWIIDISDRMQIPPDFSAASAIIVLSSLLGRKLGIRPKQRDDWLVVSNLWGAVVGRPSLLKSPAIAQVVRPLDYLVREALNQYESDAARYDLEEMGSKARRDALQKKLNNAAKSNADLQEILNAQKLETLEEPVLKRYKTEDGTVEKIGEILVQNSNGILIHRDELTGWLKSLDKDGREGDRAFYLEAWNGSGSFTVDRIKRGTLHIPALCLSLLGGIQPGPLSSYIYQALKGGAGDDGLIQRFQVLVWPDSPKEWKNVDRWPDTEAKERAYDIFKKFANYSPSLQLEDSDAEIPFVRYNKPAQEIFDYWRVNLESRLLSGNLSPSMESHLAKYRSLMPSLSLIFQLCEDQDCNVETYCVGQAAAALAVKWCSYLETHAHRLYSSVESAGLDSARALFIKLQSGDVGDEFTLRDVYLKHWSKLATAEEVDRAVNILVLYGWIRVVEVKTLGRPKQLIQKHPCLIKKESE